MNTNSIKAFAQEARLLLLDGVLQRLLYWGFTEDGSHTQKLELTQGGYTYRGQVYTDTTVPKKLDVLKAKLNDKQAVTDIIEEASYTWFNRLMAIKILEENGYLEPTLAYTKGMRTPQIVHNAKKGQHTLTKKEDKALLLEYLQEDKEEQALGLLILDLCNRNQLLHQVFGKINDYTELLLPQNLLQKDGVLDLINSDAISAADYKEVELIGWLYQFYISDKKDEVFKGFKKNKKARAQDIPAATQIFTPKWIVKYMVENTVGKLYLDYESSSSLKEEMKYLVENKNDIESEAIISDITELTLMDPAAGSGHILVTGFELLFKMYREEGYTAKQAVENILQHNLFGLDIDDRAMQLARFAILLKAAQFDADILHRGIIPHVYSFPEANHFTSEELQLFLGKDGSQFTAELKDALRLLNQGKNIGSALKVELSEEAENHIKQQYKAWLQLHLQAGLDLEKLGVWNRLEPFLDVLLLLAKKYTAVVANPPYMGRKNMNSDLKKYVTNHYKHSKLDLMTVFMNVIPDLTLEKGRLAIINLPSWLFLSSFENLRKKFIETLCIDSLLHMGRGIFGIDFGSVAFIVKNNTPNNFSGNYFRLHERTFQHLKISDICSIFLNSLLDESYSYNFSSYNIVNDNSIATTNSNLKIKFSEVQQDKFLKLPGFPIAYWISNTVVHLFEKEIKLGSLFPPKQGMATTDNNRFLRYWYEVNIADISFNLTQLEYLNSSSKWFPYLKGGAFRKYYGNHEYIVNYENDGEELKTLVKEKYRGTSYAKGFSEEKWNKLIEVWVLKNQEFYFKNCISWSFISSGEFGVRSSGDGFIFDVGGSALFPNSQYKPSVSAYLNSKLAKFFLNILNPTLNYQVGNISNLPFISVKNESIISLNDINVQLTRLDWDSRETSWDFEQSPLLNDSYSLEQAYKTWQENVTQNFFQLHANEEELNRIFIDIYGLQDELTPEVALKDITILQEELDRNQLEEDENNLREQGLGISRLDQGLPLVPESYQLPIDKLEVISQFLSYGIGIFLGRYRLDKPGLNIAHPNPSEEDLTDYKYNSHSIKIDEEGIIPLMGEDCAFPDDALVRTKNLVHIIWGEDSLTENINFIHDALGMDLHRWLTEKFWTYHTSMYKKKPIYWLFSSNVKKPQKAAFKVLVYMHRMNKYTVQKIQRNYLYPHQEYIKQEIEKLTDNEENLSREDIKRLELLCNWELECRDYNEVLKELATQQITFDLDDGVKVNYAKFENAVAKI